MLLNIASIKEIVSKEIKSVKEEITSIKEVCTNKDEMVKFKEEMKTFQNDHAVPQSYADVAKSQRHDGVMVVPLDKNNLNADTISQVRTKIDLTKIKVGVSMLKPLSRGGCYIETNGHGKREALQAELQSQLGDRFSIYKPKARQRQLILTNITKNYENNELADEIKSTNIGFTIEDEIKVVSKRQSKYPIRGREKIWTYILEANELTYGKLLNKHIMVDFSHHFINEYIHVTRCFKCQKYNHKAVDCLDTPKCARCSKDHSTIDCRETKAFRCINCLDAGKKGKNYDTKHICGSHRCNSHNTIIENIKRHI